MTSPTDPDHRFLVCPRCYSTDVSYEAAAFMGQKYRCRDCGLVTTFIIEATAQELMELREGGNGGDDGEEDEAGAAEPEPAEGEGGTGGGLERG